MPALLTFWTSQFFVAEVALYIGGCLAASLACNHQMSVAVVIQLWHPECLQTLPNVPWGGGIKITPG